MIDLLQTPPQKGANDCYHYAPFGKLLSVLADIKLDCKDTLISVEHQLMMIDCDQFVANYPLSDVCHKVDSQ